MDSAMCQNHKIIHFQPLLLLQK